MEKLLASPRETTTVSLGASGRILFYTDGISGAQDSSAQFYPPERCASLLAGCIHQVAAMRAASAPPTPVSMAEAGATGMVRRACARWR